MLTLPDAIVPLLLPFATLFTNPTWQKAQLLLVGAILPPGQRTVAAALRVMGRSDQRDYARYHEVLNRAVWSSCAVARVLLLLLLQHLALRLRSGGATPRWSSASTKPWNGAAVPGSRPGEYTGTRCVPAVINWSRPVACAGSP